MYLQLEEKNILNTKHLIMQAIIKILTKFCIMLSINAAADLGQSKLTSEY